MSDAPQVPSVDAESPRTPWEPTESGAIPFVHLHTHSHYSLLDGVGKLDALLARAKELEMPALALTDHGNLYGALEFYQKALEVGVKPILGYEAYVAPISRFDKTEKRSYHLTLLATNRKGYENLLVLSSLAYTEGFYYKPRIDRDLLKEHSEGLICLSGCLAGEVARTLANGNGSPESYAKARDAALWHRELFGDRYYLELQDHGIAEQKIALQGTLRISQELGIPTVISNDVHYVRREDADAQDLVLCVNTGKFRTDPNRMRMDSDEFYLKSGAEMMERAVGFEDAVWRSLEIADRCNLELELGKRFFPIFIPPDNKTPDEYLRELCIQGLKRRYANNPKRLIDGELSDEVMARLNRELGVIAKLGFATYFLIVWDFVRVAEERGVHRTARGSGVGAIVCYALNMSHVCPLEFDLLFERFLDENRIEAPDIDIDFEQSRRGEIIDYVKEHYGSEKVAQLGVLLFLQQFFHGFQQFVQTFLHGFHVIVDFVINVFVCILFVSVICAAFDVYFVKVGFVFVLRIMVEHTFGHSAASFPESVGTLKNKTPIVRSGTLEESPPVGNRVPPPFEL